MDTTVPIVRFLLPITPSSTAIQRFMKNLFPTQINIKIFVFPNFQKKKKKIFKIEKNEKEIFFWRFFFQHDSI